MPNAFHCSSDGNGNPNFSSTIRWETSRPTEPLKKLGILCFEKLTFHMRHCWKICLFHLTSFRPSQKSKIFFATIYASAQARKKKRKCCHVKSLNCKVCLTVTAIPPDLLRKRSSFVSLISKNNKQVFHFRTLLTPRKARTAKRFRLLTFKASTEERLLLAEGTEMKTRRTGRAG